MRIQFNSQIVSVEVRAGTPMLRGLAHLVLTPRNSIYVKGQGINLVLTPHGMSLFIGGASRKGFDAH